MRWQSTIVVPLLCLGTFVWAQNDQTSSANQNERNTAGSSELQKATEVVEHMSATAPDKGVPKQVLEGAKCVAVIPKLVKGAFVVGGEHGTGAATCRISGNSWSAPARHSRFPASAGVRRLAGKAATC
jgi:lipid-binding SYLF domain-containing protein